MYLDNSVSFMDFEAGGFKIAMTGQVFEYILSHYSSKMKNQMLESCVVYAMMSPIQKAMLVEQL